ncbi:hypothetical protein BGZ97_001283 [Linnemannia gamsii]|uniref:KfrA N-terminal DNA-binding domain-containing protein n=1 Tax=Linnemannia gamsii TaxID=64522 RepID=A0A9P6UT96_9FUNG|nr:hypothetical protein BGZ97_001283 [Linnemannia gamsii]
MAFEPSTSKEEQIYAIANELAKQGLRPTMDMVRERLGGSYSTIGPIMQRWKAHRQSTEIVKRTREPASQAILDKSRELANEIWAAANGVFEARLKSEREALELERTGYKVEINEALELADQHEKACQTLHQQVNQLTQALEAAREEMRTLTGRVATAETLADGLEKRTSELQEALREQKQRSAEVINKLERAKQKLEAECIQIRQEAREVAGKYERSLGELEALRGQIAKQDMLISNFALGRKTER